MRWIVLLTAVLLGLLPAGARAAPHATDFALDVPAAASPTARAAAHGRPWTSPVLRPGRRFDVFGLKWRRAPHGVDAEVRVRPAGGRWRRWTAVPHGHSGRVSDPVWAGGATEVQVRLEHPVRGLRLHFVRVSGARRPARPVARAAQAAPAVVPRAQWGGDTACRPRRPASIGTVQMAFVHHTVNANEYGPEDSAAMVLGICRFHRNGNGWDDVGYNFLVDRYGQIFEGRAGGIDQAVVGAQAQGWNAQSTGIANLGTYDAVPQSDAAVDALARLIAWKLPLHGVPVTGEVALESAGGSSNRYRAGTIQTFQRISGHTDGNATACPGAQLYAQLPHVRALAEQHAPALVGAAPGVPSGATLTLSAARRALAYPEPARLTGRLTGPDGRPLANALVRLQIHGSTGFRPAKGPPVATDALGTFTAELETAWNRTVRAVAGDVASNTVRVTVRPTLLVEPPAKRVKAGRRSVLEGTVQPKKGRLYVEAARQSGRRYVRSHRARVRARNGRFRAAVPLVRPGLYRVRIRFAGDRTNRPSTSDFYVRAVRRASSVNAVPAARADR